MEPSRYTCPTHQADLTPLVDEAVEEIGPPNVYVGARRRGPAPFTVIVSCPGDASPSSGHDLTFSGHYTR